MTANQTCSDCEEDPAVVVCKCRLSPTLLCLRCSVQHQVKLPTLPHIIMPVAAIDQNPEDYLRKVNAVNQNKAALRRNVEVMRRFEEELTASVQTAINGLIGYLDTTLNLLRAEKTELAQAVEAAIEEAERCVIQNCCPNTPLAKAICTLTPIKLCLFTYALNPPHIESLWEVWSIYQNGLPALCEQFCTQFQMEINPTLEIAAFEVHPMKATLLGISAKLPFSQKLSERICHRPFTKRILKELRDINSFQDSRCVVYNAPEGENSDFIAELMGPEDSPYAGLIFTLTVSVPEDYPFKDYDIRFVTPVYHPNIITGQKIDFEWYLIYTLRVLFLMIGALMASPVECVVDEKIAREFREHPTAFAIKARNLALKHARPVRRY